MMSGQKETEDRVWPPCPECGADAIGLGYYPPKNIYWDAARGVYTFAEEDGVEIRLLCRKCSHEYGVLADTIISGREKEGYGVLGGCGVTLRYFAERRGQEWKPKGAPQSGITVGECGRNLFCPTCASKLKDDRDKAHQEAATNALTAKAFEKRWQGAKDERDEARDSDAKTHEIMMGFLRQLEDIDHVLDAELDVTAEMVMSERVRRVRTLKDDNAILREDMEAWHPFSAQDVVERCKAYKGRLGEIEKFAKVGLEMAGDDGWFTYGTITTLIEQAEEAFPLPADSQGGADEQKQD